MSGITCNLSTGTEDCINDCKNKTVKVCGITQCYGDATSFTRHVHVATITVSFLLYTGTLPKKEGQKM